MRDISDQQEGDKMEEKVKGRRCDRKLIDLQENPTIRLPDIKLNKSLFWNKVKSIIWALHAFKLSFVKYKRR